MPKVKLTSEGLKNSLKHYDIKEAVIEYVWNGFDAKATRIDITTEKNELDAITKLIIKDNGIGIEFSELDNKFGPAYESEKKNKTDIEALNVKGKKGVGRYSFYEVASSASWETIFKSESGNKTYIINIREDDLINYMPTEPKETTSDTGTTVSLNLNNNINIDEIIQELKIVFAWYLQLYKDKSIHINGIPLDCSDILYSEETRSFEIEDFKAEITVCVWTRKLNEEYSKYYYIDGYEVVRHKENTTLNNKGDNFYHSVFIKSNLFNIDKFSFTSQLDDGNLVDLKTKKSKEFKQLKLECDKFLVEIRRPFIKAYAKSFIEKLKEKKVYPQYNTNNVIDRFKEEQLDDLIANVYYFVPKVFTSLNKIQQKTLIRLFELIQDSGETDNLFKILGDVTELTSQERQDMAELLDKVELNNVLSMLQLITDRLQAIKDFKELIKKERVANEVDHIQKFIEKHYWFFGEEYHLVTAEEPDFEEALRMYLNYASDNYYEKGSVVIEDEDKYKQMDIFAIQSLPCGDVKKCIVVELKRPSVTLGRTELDQLKKYFGVITREDRFNAANINWEFYLVGNKYNDEIKWELQSNKEHGEKSLAFNIDKCKIYVKTWSEIFTELELNFNYLQEKLKFDYSKLTDNKNLTSNEIVLSQEVNSATRTIAMSDKEN
ncbi:MAG: ATP-binding protein [Christensenellales bacterium]